MKTILFVVVIINLSIHDDKYKDFDVKSDTQLIAPVAYGNFVLRDILAGFDEDSVFQNGSENELTFSFRGEKIAKVYMDEIIDFPSAIDLTTQSRTLGNLTLKPYSFREAITIADLKQRLPNHQIVNQIPENKTAIFPEISLGNEFANDLIFEISDFDFLQYGLFVTGKIDCVFRNDFPSNCIATIEITDLNSDFIEVKEFGSGRTNGLKPQETELMVIDLAGKTVLAPLFYKIVALHVFESDEPVYIQNANGIRLNIDI